MAEPFTIDVRIEIDPVKGGVATEEVYQAEVLELAKVGVPELIADFQYVTSVVVLKDGDPDEQTRINSTATKFIK